MQIPAQARSGADVYAGGCSNRVAGYRFEYALQARGGRIRAAMPSFDTLVPVGAFALLCLAFAVKHVGPDFLLQSNWMAQGKVRASAGAGPLCARAGLHCLGTLLIALVVKTALWWLGLVEFAV